MIADRRRYGIAVDQQRKLQIVAPEENCSTSLLKTEQLFDLGQVVSPATVVEFSGGSR
jgi:hypothetical protein